MGCGCRKKQKDSMTASGYELRRPDGTTSEHPTKLAAEAAKARAGGGRIVAKK